MKELCGIYGIARETGYNWLRRYREQGWKGCGMWAAPHRHPNQTAEEIEQAVLELRREHTRWGPRKLKRVLERQDPTLRFGLCLSFIDHRRALP